MGENKSHVDDLVREVTYEFFEENRYKITDFTYAGLEYTGMCNNGYTKLHTLKGKAYWLAQNELGHLTPDWKFHVSVRHEDVKKAWNLIIKIFLENECRSGMKVLYLKENTNTAKGREITIYIFKYSDEYKDSPIATDYKLGFHDEHSEEYWINMVNTIENELDKEGIKPNGLAKGDLAIGKYVSLRNEAFVFDNESKLCIYPPDERGYNGAGQELPFNLQKFVVKTGRLNGIHTSKYFIFTIIILFFSFFIFQYNK